MEISLVGVLLATVSAFVVGSLWYSPSLFLNQWKKMVGADDAHMKEKFGSSMVYIAVASIITAYVLAVFTNYTIQATGASNLMAGVQTAFWLWLGIAATTVVANGALDTRPPMLMVIQAGNRLVTLLLMGIIIGLFR